MKVSKELIEKYHRGECSEEERIVVEEWLFDDSFDESLLLPVGEDKEQHKQQMWESIAPPDFSGEKKSRPTISPVWFRLVAALVLTIAALSVWKTLNPPAPQRILEANNASEIQNREISSSLYNVSLGPRSNVRIDQQYEVMEICGTLAFKPNQDVTMKIVGECPVGESSEKIVELKSGASYIAFSFRNSPDKTELVVLEQNRLNTLPPLLQKQLITQFNI